MGRKDRFSVLRGELLESRAKTLGEAEAISVSEGETGIQGDWVKLRVDW